MKKILSLALACVLVVGMLFTLASCGDSLSGTYDGTLFDLRFKGENVTVIVGNTELTGTYDIDEEDGKKTISFDFIDEDKATDEQKGILELLDSWLSGEIPFAKDGNKITIGSGFAAMTFEKK